MLEDLPSVVFVNGYNVSVSECLMLQMANVLMPNKSLPLPDCHNSCCPIPAPPSCILFLLCELQSRPGLPVQLSLQVAKPTRIARPHPTRDAHGAPTPRANSREHRPEKHNNDTSSSSSPAMCRGVSRRRRGPQRRRAVRRYTWSLARCLRGTQTQQPPCLNDFSKVSPLPKVAGIIGLASSSNRRLAVWLR